MQINIIKLFENYQNTYYIKNIKDFNLFIEKLLESHPIWVKYNKKVKYYSYVKKYWND